jgi:integrase
MIVAAGNDDIDLYLQNQGWFTSRTLDSSGSEQPRGSHLFLPTTGPSPQCANEIHWPIRRNGAPVDPKKRYRLPTILSQEEVAQLIEAAPTPFYRTILVTLYGTGVRRTELTRLKVSDIDSRRMVVHIQGGKGQRDRDVMLSPVLLAELRAHWARYSTNFTNGADCL